MERNVPVHHLLPAMHDPRLDLTRVLHQAASGDAEAANDLWDLTYQELRVIAGRHLLRERVDHTLSPTALVHEAYLRLVDQTRVEWKDRNHFFAIASRMCRRVLVDHARRRVAAKRGGEAVRITLDDGTPGPEGPAHEILALDEALDRLAHLNERLGRVVEMRYFGGLTEEEIAESLGVTPRTVRRDWVKAKGFLYDMLHGGSGGAAPGVSES
jgi:RNA polymerase sigma factor (TIGR02999 family)